MKNQTVNGSTKKYWILESGMLMSSSGNVNLRNATQISKAKFYKLRKERERIERELEESPISFGSDGTMYMRF
jgi:hypothetical protein